jgi:uncharacterized protein (TIGR00725 family)
VSGAGPSWIAVVGPGRASDEEAATALAVGDGLARAGAVLVCGGLGGAMEAACRGAREAGGTTVGLLPGHDRGEANPYVDVAIPTGLGELRNGLVVRAAHAVIAVAGEYGTLSEIGFALKTGKPVVGLGTWELARGGKVDAGIVVARDPADAVDRAVQLARRRGQGFPQPVDR